MKADQKVDDGDDDDDDDDDMEEDSFLVPCSVMFLERLAFRQEL
jgi:hypothetical protein